jgi:hypothetical protein
MENFQVAVIFEGVAVMTDDRGERKILEECRSDPENGPAIVLTELYT